MVFSYWLILVISNKFKCSSNQNQLIILHFPYYRDIFSSRKISNAEWICSQSQYIWRVSDFLFYLFENYFFFIKKEIKINQRITYLHEKVSCPYFVHHLLTFDISSSVRTVGINQFRERDFKIALLGICSRGVQFYCRFCISSSNSLLQFFHIFNSLCCECYSL